VDVIGEAMKIFQQSRRDIHLEISINDVVDESMPVSYFFRKVGSMGSVEQYAIENSRGKILDVGAGAGCHSLELQARELDVTPIDLSISAVEVMKNRGLAHARVADVMTEAGTYDTILLLMNGLGIGQTVEGTRELLSHLKTLLAPEGQIFGDSTNISYMFDRGELQSQPHYFGEVKFGVSAKEIGAQEFPWIFIDAHELTNVCNDLNMNCEIIGSDDGFHYLSRLTNA
jgi:2-polyprenyl-3-methyl-5-hydroxy-6-metoxy-1,4-benzoquinol methylase